MLLSHDEPLWGKVFFAFKLPRTRASPLCRTHFVLLTGRNLALHGGLVFGTTVSFYDSICDDLDSTPLQKSGCSSDFYRSIIETGTQTSYSMLRRDILKWEMRREKNVNVCESAFT